MVRKPYLTVVEFEQIVDVLLGELPGVLLHLTVEFRDAALRQGIDVEFLKELLGRLEGVVNVHIVEPHEEGFLAVPRLVEPVKRVLGDGRRLGIRGGVRGEGKVVPSAAEETVDSGIGIETSLDVVLYAGNGVGSLCGVVENIEADVIVFILA